ncbi:OsmC family protein [Agrococcus sediminis]|uniref:OsmC family protein n=1 Tax=Agrococcus sediminis TaxID=2599924 RepID=A0A5M8QIL6_9MICO|nr:OsmC family protein [Agrococcus sediminis]KAA6435098.1 OsmC family protein [Agrococcus sediminis]
MSITTASAAPVTDADREARLDEAERAWGERLAADVANARLVFRADGEAQGAVATRIRAGRHEWLIDEPAGLAGDDAGASPVEAALGALLACQTVVYRLYAKRLGLAIDRLELRAEGDLDVRGLFGADDVRPGFAGVRVVVDIDGPHERARFEELRRLVDAHCPVHDLFSNPTPVETRLA